MRLASAPRFPSFLPGTFALATLLLVPLGGCVHHRPGAPAPAARAAAEPAPGPAAADPVPVAEAVDEALLQARTHEADGLRALEEGSFELAREAFERALLALAEAGGDPRAAEVERQIERRLSGIEEQVELVAEAQPEVEPSPLDELADVHPDLTPEELERERKLAESQETVFDIPMVLNDRVLGMLDFYTGRHRDKFLPGLIRSGRYLPMIHRIFEEEGLPKDLAYMAHVESAYKVTAYSRAHAKGIFQFITPTGRRYGLRIDYWVDERSDPEKATRAAAAYLKDLYAMFGDWHLAMAAYNGGEGRVQRSLARTGARDFWQLAARRGALHNETRNYVPAILAATLISREPSKYGFEFQYDDPIEYETIQVEGAVDLQVLAKCAGTETQTLKDLNPALRRAMTPPGRTTDVRVPRGTGEATLLALAQVPESERVLFAQHVIRSGDTLSALANRYRTSVVAIQQANHMGRSTLLRVGRVLQIPTSGGGVLSASSFPDDYDAHGGAPFVYRVRRGDTLSGIARRYGTTAQAIAAANGISVQRILQVGQRLTVVPGARTASAAAAATRGGPSAPRRSSDTASAAGALVHTVRPGESLWRIATRYGMTVDELCAINRISRNDVLHPGIRLTIRTQ
jgi:membrane-bound lytic murein transglycosylase D